MIRHKWILFAMTLVLPARAQECRFSAITPAQPPLKIEEGERATESQTFQTTAFALSPANVVHFFDSASRIRRVEPNGRMTTLAGNGIRGDRVVAGPALETALPAVVQILFSPSGVLHFVAAERIWRIVNSTIEPAAGSGRPGFNGESAPALQINLGAIVNAAFNASGELLILDGFARVRRLDSDGTISTIAGSTRVAAAAGFTGDNGPATAAALSSPRQIVPLRDGSLWIKDLSGRHLRVLTPDGVIRTINQNFDASVNIVLLADGTPAAATANRVYPFRGNGSIETGANPFPPFTGTPLGVGSDGALYYLGSARPEQRNPLVRIANGPPTVIASAPVAATVDGQAPPFGVWHPRSNTLLYAATAGGKSGILEAQPGQAPRFVVGGGADTGEPDSKAATSLSIYGIVAFSVDGEGRIVLADVFRRRILVVATDGKVSVLKTQGGEPVIYAPLGSFGNLQRIAADDDGNIYWFVQGATPAGGVFTADIAVWTRASQSLSTFTVNGLSALVRLDDGTVAVLAGNSGSFRTAYRVTPSGQQNELPAFRMAPLQSVTRWRQGSYFTAASRLFRGEPGRFQMLNLSTLASGALFQPDFVLAGRNSLLVHLSDGGFYQIDNPDACDWLSQPVIAPNGIVNAASYEFANTISPRQLITIFGSGLGPVEGQGLVLNGVLRAGGQPPPYPALVLGNFSGNIPNATLTGTTLPVIYSNDRQVTVQGVTGVPNSGEYLLYFSWQGLQLIHPTPVRVVPATPGLFTEQGEKDGLALALNESGSLHSVANPAERGSVVQLFGTGFGDLANNLATGDFFSLTAPVSHIRDVTVTIGGRQAVVEFAGGATGLIAGTTQLNVRVPEALSPGAHPVIVEVAGQLEPSTQRVTLQVR
ncbi:MAG: hypothetical protein ACRD8O_13910 [Bryobacteraceae bacterium]